MRHQFVVETSFPDGWRCERHAIKARDAAQAIELALQQAGECNDYFISSEAGETEVDAVSEVIDGQLVPIDPASWRRYAGASKAPAVAVDALATALRDVLREAGDRVSADTKMRALRALSQIGAHVV
jgi:hypothetical protein